MKKLIALLLVLVMAIGMVACAPADKEEEKKPALVLDEQGMGMCTVCNESVQWTKFDGKEVLELTGKHHYYLAEDVNFTKDFACMFGTIADSFVCFHLNGHTLTTGSRFWTLDNESASAEEKATFNLIAEGGSIVYTGASAATVCGFEHNEGFMNVYGGTYKVSFADGVAARPFLQNSRNVVLQDAAVTGGITLVSVRSMLTLKGSTTVDLIQVAFDERDHRAEKEVVIDSSWTGTATMEVPETALVDGVLDPTRYAATGDFTGTLTLTTGEQIVNSNGQLVVKK